MFRIEKGVESPSHKVIKKYEVVHFTKDIISAFQYVGNRMSETISPGVTFRVKDSNRRATLFARTQVDGVYFSVWVEGIGKRSYRTFGHFANFIKSLEALKERYSREEDEDEPEAEVGVGFIQSSGWDDCHRTFGKRT